MGQKAIVLFLLLLTVTATVMPAMAARDAGEIADGIIEQANRMGTALVAIGAVLGIFCIIWGGLYF